MDISIIKKLNINEQNNINVIKEKKNETREKQRTPFMSSTYQQKTVELQNMVSYNIILNHIIR